RRCRADTSICARYCAQCGSTSACLAARRRCSVPAGNCQRRGRGSSALWSRRRLPKRPEKRQEKRPMAGLLESLAYASPGTPRDPTPPKLVKDWGGNRPQIRRGLGLIRAGVPAPERPEFTLGCVTLLARQHVREQLVALAVKPDQPHLLDRPVVG